MKNTESLPVSKIEIEQPKLSVDVPSSRSALEYLHDINASVIFAQLETGARLSRQLKAVGYDVSPSTFWISPSWWTQHVDSSNSFGGMADSFDKAYRDYVDEQLVTFTGEQVDVAVVDGAADDQVYTAEEARLVDVNESYKMTVLLAAALSEAEDNVKNFAKVAGYHGVPQQDTGEFLQDLLTHVVEKYHLTLSEDEITSIIGSLQLNLARSELNNDALNMTREHNDMMNDLFGLTTPESRTYGPYEDYRFMVHVVKNDVTQRAAEIGSPHGEGVLMASLVSTHHKGTFTGGGGIILAEPAPELITGVAAFDVGGNNASETRATLDELLIPASNSEYNQIDMKFEATKPIGVMIKRAMSDRHELGSASTNTQLREYAAQHNLPVVEVLVPPDTLPLELMSRWEITDDGNQLLTVDVPDTPEQYYRVQVLHGSAYGMEEGEDSMARVMKMSAYGEAPQDLAPEERQKALVGLAELLDQPKSGVTQKDIDTVNRDLDKLTKGRQ